VKHTKKDMLALYSDSFGAPPPGQEQDVIDEMRAVLNAPTAAEAVDIIEYWGCWDENHTVLDAVRKLRSEPETCASCAALRAELAERDEEVEKLEDERDRVEESESVLRKRAMGAEAEVKRLTIERNTLEGGGKP